MPVRRVRVCVPLAAVFLVAACCAAQETHSPRSADPAQTTPDAKTGEKPAFNPKDLIANAHEIEKDVEQLRGWKFKHEVKTAVYTETQLRRFIEKRLFEEDYGDGRLEATEALLRMTGMIPADCDLRKTIMDVLLNQIGGFYDPATKGFYMLQRQGVDYGAFVNNMLIAHELTHALDDQYVDLDKLMKSHEPTEDWSLAIGSVVEGSATVLMQRYALLAQTKGTFDAEQIGRVAASEMQRAQILFDSPRYFTTLMANYLCGMFFMTRNQPVIALPGAAETMQRNVRAATSDPPVSTEQILHPDKYWNRAERDDPVLVNDQDVERMLAHDGRFVVHKNTLGELLCAVLTTPDDESFDILLSAAPSYWTNDAATGWGGDRFFLLAEGKDAAAAKRDLKGLRGVWLTTWDTPTDRDEFVEDYASERGDPKRSLIKLSKRGAVYLFGFSERERNELTKQLAAAAPRFTKDGKPWSPDGD